MWTVAIWFFMFMFAINGMMLFISDAMPAYSLVSPINNATITPPAQPNVIGNLSVINSSNPSNATAGGTVSIWDTVNYAWNQTIFVVHLLTGGFIWNALAVFGLPDIVFGIIQGSIGIFLILTVLHFWRGIL